MRVLHLTSGNMYGGVETFLTTLLREAGAAPSLEPEFAVCFEGRFSRELESLGHAPHHLPAVKLSHPLSVRRARRALSALLHSGSYDIVVCHQPWACVLFASTIRAAGLPVIVWVHMAGDGRHWLERLCRLTSPDVAICNSRYTAERTSRWLPNTSVEYVYCPLSPMAPATRAQRSRLRAALETHESDLVIAQVSRLEPWKGQHVLISALAALRDVPGWTCWLVGGAQRAPEARYVRDLKGLANTHGIAHRVRFLGERQDVPAILGASDLLCQPNTSPEPFGLALVEAQQAGLPVLTSGIGGALEIVDGSCGVLTAPGNVSALSDALRRLIVDHPFRARLSAESRRRADDLCNAPRQIRRIEVVLATALTVPRLVRQRPVGASLR